MIVKAVENIMVSISTIAAMIFQNSAIVFTPLAPTIWTGAVFGTAITPMVGGTLGAALGIALGVGMEGTGMLCFKAAQDEPRWYGKIYPILYLAAGITISAVLKPEFFLVAVMLFLMVGLTYAVSSQNLKNQERKREATEAKRLELLEKQKQAEQNAVALQLQAEKEAEILRLEKQAEQERKLAVIAAKKDIELAKLSETSQKLSAPEETFQKLSETFPSHWTGLTAKHHAMIKNMSKAQVAETFGVTERTASNWHNRLGVK
jgi:large-conductance mechanosensitive channel